MIRVFDLRRETEWESWYAWHSVWLETQFSNGADFVFRDELLRKAWLERVERRKIGIPNCGWRWIYRLLGSTWDLKRRKPGGLKSRKPGAE